MSDKCDCTWCTAQKTAKSMQSVLDSHKASGSTPEELANVYLFLWLKCHMDAMPDSVSDSPLATLGAAMVAVESGLLAIFSDHEGGPPLPDFLTS